MCLPPLKSLQFLLVASSIKLTLPTTVGLHQNLIKLMLLISARHALDLSMPYDRVSTKIYDKQDDFDFKILFLDGDVSRRTTYGVFTK